MAKLIRIRVWLLLAAFLYTPVVQAQETDPAKNDPRTFSGALAGREHQRFGTELPARRG